MNTTNAMHATAMDATAMNATARKATAMKATAMNAKTRSNSMRTLPITLGLALAGVVTLGAGRAAAEPAEAHGYAGLRLGGIVPLDGLSPFVSGGIELGAVLPPLDRRLAIAVAVDYTQPSTTGTEMDPRVAGGTYTWSLTERELAVMPLLVFRATQVHAFTPYVGIGPRILFLESTTEDDGMPTISQTKEVSTEVGVGVPIGGELRAGPGRLTAELLLQYGALDHVATGDSHTGALGLTVGYRAFF